MSEKSYLTLKTTVIEEIGRGAYKPHDRLPSQRQMIRQYGLSHMSVRRAINELTSEGVIYARAGKGLFVAEPKQEAELDPLYSFSHDMALRGMRASSRLLGAEVVSASTVMAHTLQVVVGSPLIYLRRLRLADGEPMALQTSYLPQPLCPDLLGCDLERGSLFEILRGHYGLRLTRAETAAEAEIADEEAAALLKLSRPAALLVTEQITYLDSGQPVEFTRSAYRGDRYRLRMDKR